MVCRRSVHARLSLRLIVEAKGNSSTPAPPSHPPIQPNPPMQVIAFWLAVVALGLVFGLRFLDATVSDFPAPEGR